MGEQEVGQPSTITGATVPRQLPAQNSTLVTYFMLLSAAVTMRTVLCSKLAYSEVTLHDLAGWIADHPTSSVSRRKMADITLERLEQYLGLSTCVDIIHKKNVKDYWS